MNEVWVVRNQRGHYWGKGKIWLDGREPRAVKCCKFRDEAVNTLVELSAKEVELRGEVISATVDERGIPALPISTTPLPPECTVAEPVPPDVEVPYPPSQG